MTSNREEKVKVVLIVDDEPDLRELLSMRFRKRGLKVLEAEGGIQALQIISSNKVDFVVSDIRMPNGDGLYLLDELKKLNPHLPFVFFTGYSEIKEIEAYDRGAEGFLMKALTMKEVVDYTLERVERFEKALTLPPTMGTQVPMIHLKYVSLENAKKISSFDLGRGGFAFRKEGPNDAIEIKNYVTFHFEFEFETSPIKRLRGTGYVLWKYQPVNQNSTYFGVELHYLKDEDRQQFVEWVALKNPTAYIPKLY